MADPRYPYSSPVNSDEQRAAQMSTGYVNAPTYVPVVPESKAVASRRGVVAACILLFAKLVLLVDKFIPWSYELSALYASRTQGTSFWFWMVVNGVLIAFLIIYLAKRVNPLRYIVAGVVLVTYLIMQPWAAVAFRMPWYTPYLPYYSGMDSLRSVATWVLSLTCIVAAILLAIPDRKRVVPADRY